MDYIYLNTKQINRLKILINGSIIVPLPAQKSSPYNDPTPKRVTNKLFIGHSLFVVSRL